jgi:hypothetical protein
MLRSLHEKPQRATLLRFPRNAFRASEKRIDQFGVKLGLGRLCRNGRRSSTDGWPSYSLCVAAICRLAICVLGFAEISLVGHHPIHCDPMLCLLGRQLAGADERMEPILKLVLDVRIPTFVWKRIVSCA